MCMRKSRSMLSKIFHKKRPEDNVPNVPKPGGPIKPPGTKSTKITKESDAKLYEAVDRLVDKANTAIDIAKSLYGDMDKPKVQPPEKRFINQDIWKRKKTTKKDKKLTGSTAKGTATLTEKRVIVIFGSCKAEENKHKSTFQEYPIAISVDQMASISTVYGPDYRGKYTCGYSETLKAFIVVGYVYTTYDHEEQELVDVRHIDMIMERVQSDFCGLPVVLRLDEYDNDSVIEYCVTKYAEYLGG